MGQKFKIRTDHSFLKWIQNFKNPEGMIARWLSVLSTYDFDIEYRCGSAHTNADAMSRKPHHKCKNQNCSDCTPLQQSTTQKVPEAVPVNQDTLSNSKGTVMPVVALTDSDLNLTTITQLIVLMKRENLNCNKTYGFKPGQMNRFKNGKH